MNQRDVRRGLNHLGIATPQSLERWVEENIERGAKREPQAVGFAVYDCTDSTPVGTAGLFQIAHAHGTAEFGIAIGERRGLGLECRGVDGVRARGLSPRRRPPRRGDESRPADGPRDHGRGPGGIRRVGAALSSQRASKLDASSQVSGFHALPVLHREAAGEDRHASARSAALRESGARQTRIGPAASTAI
jgi:hypothetical protein